MSTTTLILVSLIVAAADWIAVAADWRRAEYVLKPLTLVLLIAAALVAGVHWAVVAALCLSLLGDIFLMLPADRFIPGLAAFLLAHVFYVVGYLETDGSLIVRAVVLLAVVAISSAIGSRIRAGIRAKGLDRFEKPVVAYVFVISAMVWCVVTASIVLPVPQRYFAAIGAVLFYTSDALIGWTRFVRAIAHGRVAIMVTYHLGQIGLLLGATTQA